MTWSRHFSRTWIWYKRVEGLFLLFWGGPEWSVVEEDIFMMGLNLGQQVGVVEEEWVISVISLAREAGCFYSPLFRGCTEIFKMRNRARLLGSTDVFKKKKNLLWKLSTIMEE